MVVGSIPVAVTYTRCIKKIKVELELSNHATKSDLKMPTSVNTSKFAEKTNLASLNTDIDKLDIDKFEK